MTSPFPVATPEMLKLIGPQNLLQEIAMHSRHIIRCLSSISQQIVSRSSLAGIAAAMLGSCILGPSSLQAQHLELYKLPDGNPYSAVYGGESKWLVSQKDPRSHLHLLPDLEEVDLLSHKISQAEMRYVLSLKGLLSLTIGSAPDTVTCEDGVIEAVSRNETIEQLSVCKQGLNDPEVKLLVQIPTLRELTLEGESLENREVKEDAVTERGLMQIAACKKLRMLKINMSTEVSDEFLEEIAKLPELRSLELGPTRFTDRGLEIMRSRMKLESLRIRSSGLPSRGVEALCAIPGIQDLRIGHKQIRTAPVRETGAREVVRVTP